MDVDEDDGHGLGGGGGGGGAYAWTAGYERTWEAVREDAWGSLAGAVSAAAQSARRAQLRRAAAAAGSAAAVQRGVVRTMALILDASRAMEDNDFRPVRIDCALAAAERFVTDFFDQNPLSLLCVIVMREGLAHVISHMGGNPVAHLDRIRDRENREPKGEASLQNALELALEAGLSGAPPHSTREVLLITGSLTSWDPGDLHAAVDALRVAGCRISAVAMAAEVHAIKAMCRSTGGRFAVALNEAHFNELVAAHIPPPEVHEVEGQPATREARLVKMGFPTRVDDGSGGPALYPCPVCRYPSTLLPAQCPACSLQLVSSPLLARSYRHLVPVPVFTEVSPDRVRALQDAGGEQAASRSECFACLSEFPPLTQPVAPQGPAGGAAGGAAGGTDTASGHGPGMVAPQNAASRAGAGPAAGQDAAAPAAAAAASSTTGRFECGECKRWFCLDCDVYVHEVVRNCPGCLAGTQLAPTVYPDAAPRHPHPAPAPAASSSASPPAPNLASSSSSATRPPSNPPLPQFRSAPLPDGPHAASSSPSPPAGPPAPSGYNTAARGNGRAAHPAPALASHLPSPPAYGNHSAGAAAGANNHAHGGAGSGSGARDGGPQGHRPRLLVRAGSVSGGGGGAGSPGSLGPESPGSAGSGSGGMSAGPPGSGGGVGGPVRTGGLKLKMKLAVKGPGGK